MHICVYIYVYIYICLYVHMFFLSAQGTRWYVKEQIQPISVTWVSVILFYFFKNIKNIEWHISQIAVLDPGGG